MGQCLAIRKSGHILHPPLASSLELEWPHKPFDSRYSDGTPQLSHRGQIGQFDGHRLCGVLRALRAAWRRAFGANAHDEEHGGGEKSVFF